MADQAQSLREMVTRFSPDHRGAEQDTAPIPKIVTITSGKGGAGKSSVAVNLAIALSNFGLKVLIIDADFGLANIDVMLGVPTQYNLSHLLRKEKTIDMIVQEGVNGIRFISGGSGIAELLQMNEKQLEKIIDEFLNYTDTNDIIIFDTSAGVHENITKLVAISTETILVTTPEPTAILDAYALIKTISRSGQLPTTRLIMNKAVSQKEADNAINSFVQITRKYLNEKIEPLGAILYDDEVVKSIKSQTPIMISNPRGMTARSIMAIAEKLINMPPTTYSSGPLANLFSRFLRQRA